MKITEKERKKENNLKAEQKYKGLLFFVLVFIKIQNGFQLVLPPVMLNTVEHRRNSVFEISRILLFSRQVLL